MSGHRRSRYDRRMRELSTGVVENVCRSADPVCRTTVSLAATRTAMVFGASVRRIGPTLCDGMHHATRLRPRSMSTANSDARVSDDPLDDPVLATLPENVRTSVHRLIARCAADRDVADQARERAEQQRNRFARALVQRDRCRPDANMPSALIGMIHRAEKLLGVDPGRRTRRGWIAPADANSDGDPPASPPSDTAA